MTNQSKWVLLLTLLAGAGVLVYNLWSYSCGHCPLNSLMTLGPPGYVLLSANAGLAAVWLWLKRRGHRRETGHHCWCGTPLANSWYYCPVCGSKSG